MLASIFSVICWIAAIYTALMLTAALFAARIIDWTKAAKAALVVGMFAALAKYIGA